MRVVNRLDPTATPDAHVRTIDTMPAVLLFAAFLFGSELTMPRAGRSDVALMDIRTPGTDGLAATTAIRADPALADTKVLILTTFETDEYVAGALRAGASGFLGKDVTADELLDGIRTVAAGERLLSPLGARDRAQLVVMAYRSGLVTADFRTNHA